MSLFTIIYIIFLMICFLSKDIKKSIFATLLSMTLQCSNLIESNYITFGPQVAVSFLFIIKYLLVYSKGNIRIIKEKRFRFIDTLLLLYILVTIISTLKNGVFTEKYIIIIQLTIYVFCYICMRKTFLTLEENDIYKIVRNVIIFIVTIGIIQLLATNIFPFLRIILKPLFYNDDSLNVYFNYNDSYHNKRLYSLFMEPSYLAGLLVGSFYYFLSFPKKLKKNIILLIIIVLEIILTTSSTAYAAFMILGIIFVLYSKQISIKNKIIIVILGLLISFILYFFFYDLLDMVIFSKSQSGSGITRSRLNKEAMLAYESSPLFGVGYKNTRGSSIICSMLGELGILGLTTYLLFCGFSLFKFFIKNKKIKLTNGYYGAMAGVLAVAICQIVACPDFDLCTFWFWLYILVLYEGQFIKSKFYGGS